MVEETVLEEISRLRCFLDQSLFCSQILLNLVHNDFLLILLFFIKWSWIHSSKSNSIVGVIVVVIVQVVQHLDEFLFLLITFKIDTVKNILDRKISLKISKLKIRFTHIFKIGTGSEVTPGCPLFMCSE